MSMQMEQEKHAFEMQRDQEKMALEREKMHMSFQMDQQRASLDLQNRQDVAQFDLQTKKASEEVKAEPMVTSVVDVLTKAVEGMQNTQALLAEQVQKVAEIAAAERVSEIEVDPKTGREIGRSRLVTK
jgi:hypothetical protein